jgi:hypothetical protein
MQTKPSLPKRLAWMAAIWAASVIALGLITRVIHLIL